MIQTTELFLNSLSLVDYINVTIIMRHLFLRHISDDCGHPDMHYSIKHLQIIKLMITINTVKMHD